MKVYLASIGSIDGMHKIFIADDGVEARILFSAFKLFPLTSNNNKPSRTQRHRLSAIESFLSGLYSKWGRIDWFLDSGAFSFQMLYARKQVLYSVSVYERYLVSYLEWISDLPERLRPSVVVELDLQNLLPYREIERWRLHYFLPFQKETGIPVIFAIRPQTYEADVEFVFGNSAVRYFATSALTAALNTENAIDTTVSLTYRGYAEGKRMHGFASIKPSLLLRIPYYSVDSISWAMPLFYGKVLKWDNQSGRFKSARVGTRGKSKPHDGNVLLEALKLNDDIIVRTILTKKRRSGVDAWVRPLRKSIMAYKELEQWYTAYWKKKGIDWDRVDNESKDKEATV
jgi:hypothetical protein